MDAFPGPSDDAAQTKISNSAGEAAAAAVVVKETPNHRGVAGKRHRPTEGFVTRANYFVVDDIVWVRPKRHPYWPAEIVRPEDAAASRFRCRLFCPPRPDLSEVVAPGTAIFFFDVMHSEEDVTAKIEARLQRTQHNVAPYEEQFVAAVRQANALARVVLDPNLYTLHPQRHAVNCVPIGVVHSYFRTHTSAPRQPHTPEVKTPATALIRLSTGLENAVRDLKGFERIWVIFHFSFATVYSDVEDAKGFKCLIVPPRDSVARGVLATRSPHRPNAIGMSCVRLVDVRGSDIHIADHDLLHGTPVLDIKPYLPFCDAHPNARAGWVEALDASGSAKGDHRASGVDVPLCRSYPSGRCFRPVDVVTGLPLDLST